MSRTAITSAELAIYAEYFSSPVPARTAVGVAALPLGACVEIDLVVKA
ncbi:MAG TPA: Rid family hydrolase [Terriglobales bacterium]